MPVRQRNVQPEQAWLACQALVSHFRSTTDGVERTPQQRAQAGLLRVISEYLEEANIQAVTGRKASLARQAAQRAQREAEDAAALARGEAGKKRRRNPTAAQRFNNSLTSNIVLLGAQLAGRLTSEELLPEEARLANEVGICGNDPEYINSRDLATRQHFEQLAYERSAAGKRAAAQAAKAAKAAPQAAAPEAPVAEEADEEPELAPELLALVPEADDAPTPLGSE